MQFSVYKALKLFLIAVAENVIKNLKIFGFNTLNNIIEFIVAVKKIK